MEDLRYADAPPVEVDVVVSAPVEVVWALISDIQLPARFSTEFKGADWLDEPGVGARFVGRNEHPAIGNWQTTCTVVAYEPGKTFGYRIGEADNPAAQWRYSIASKDDQTVLRYWMKMGPGRSGLNAAIDRWPEKEAKIVARRLAEFRTNMAATLAGIKELAER